MGLVERAERRFQQAKDYGANIVHDAAIDWSRYELSEEDQARVRKAEAWESDLIDAFCMHEEVIGATPPWEGVRDKVRFRPGELSLWTGINGHLKSMALNQIALGFTAQGERTCIASFEMHPIKTLKRMARQFIRAESLSPSEVRDFFSGIQGGIWIYDQVGTVNTTRVLALSRYVREEIGCQHIIIDSLMKCGMDADDYTTQKRFIDKLCTYAKDSGLHVHLVAHSKKVADEGVPGKMDVSGHADLTNMPDNVFVIWHNKKKAKAQQDLDHAHDRESDALFICEKQRNGEWEGKLGLWFDKTSLLFSDKEARIP